MRNPSWTRDELILALDAYFRYPDSRGIKTHPKMAELSKVLNQLPIHPQAAQGVEFRNPNGVSMKLANFLRFDPDYTGKGLQAGNRLEEEVWNEFAGDQQRLAQVAAAIRGGASEVTNEPDNPDIEEAAEGKVLTRMHTMRERSSKLVKAKKKAVLDATGKLACEACGFDFKAVYGDIGDGFAECHHSKPVSELRPGEKTKLADLQIVCANCHRMIHRQRPWLTVEQISGLLSTPN